MTASRVRVREILASDLGRVADLLAIGFPGRQRDFWRAGLARLAARDAVDGLPRFGYLLEADGVPVGVQLVIAAHVDGGPQVRCNVAGWFVEPRFRGFAALLAQHALRHKQATYLNVTAAPHTRPILDALGYVSFSKGQFVAIPALARPLAGARVYADARGLSPSEREVLADHAALGCMCLVVAHAGRFHPFVLQRLRWRHVVPFARLIYCRSIADFRACAGTLGRYLVRHGVPLVMIDANGPEPGLPGRFRPTTPRYYKGTAAPRLGDLAYTEFVMFGL